MAHSSRVALLLVCFLLPLPLRASATRNNDDSCDIAVMPAATLLLPYFEVSYTSGGPTTLFTVTNATDKEQIAHVTLWTDRSYPVIDFNIYLTGYDTQSIDLYDVIVRGVIGPPAGTGTEITPEGDYSISNPKLDLSGCDQLPGPLSPFFLDRMRKAFTLGDTNECKSIGGTHTNAVGYATIDVVRTCSVRHAAMAGYLTEDILWDNVLMGDYQQVDRANNLSEGDAMVHIRAVPEGGTAAERRNNPNQYEVTFHRTFYSRFLPSSNHTFDGRQPLPALFASRWIYGSDATFQTSLKIWREGRTTLNAACAEYVQNIAGFTEVVTFDEEENPTGAIPTDVICTPIITYPVLPSTSLTSIRDTFIFPRPDRYAIAGWVYLNLDNCYRDDYASQNWVVTSMRALGRSSVDMPAFALGNGCTPPLLESEVSTAPGIVIGPPPNVNP